MSGAIPPLHNTPSWRGAQLKHADFMPEDTVTVLLPFNSDTILYLLVMKLGR